MLIAVPDVLAAAQVAECRRALDAADWIDGLETAGHQGARVKRNEQLSLRDPEAERLGQIILKALPASPLFMSAALPFRILPPMFNRYGVGQSFGTHVDGAIRVAGNGHPLRTDLSCTLFLSGPEDYDGGELVIEDTYGAKQVKLPAGHLILYPSTSLHKVMPLTRGTRVCAFFWLQSMIRDDTRRALLFDMDTAIRRLGAEQPEHPSVVQLTGVYHNLLRQWAEL